MSGSESRGKTVEGVPPTLTSKSKRLSSHPNLTEAKKFFEYKQLEHYPKGYPRLASFANSDDTFAVIPRHGRTSYRVLLHLDNKLTELEKEIDELDKKDATDKIMEKRLRRYENYDGYNDEQDKLISKSEAVYSRFADIILKDAGLRELKSPPRNTEVFSTWIWNEKPFSVDEGKSNFIFYPDDLISLAGHSQHERPFGNLIESLLDRVPSPWVKRLFQTDTERRKTDDPFVHIYSVDRVRIAANIVEVSVAISPAILLPVFSLFQMNRLIMIMVTLLLVLVFSVSLSSFTGERVNAAFCRSIAIVIGAFIVWNPTTALHLLLDG